MKKILKEHKEKIQPICSVCLLGLATQFVWAKNIYTAFAWSYLIILFLSVIIFIFANMQLIETPSQFDDNETKDKYITGSKSLTTTVCMLSIISIIILFGLGWWSLAIVKIITFIFVGVSVICMKAMVQFHDEYVLSQKTDVQSNVHEILDNIEAKHHQSIGDINNKTIAKRILKDLHYSDKHIDILKELISKNKEQ